jgi:SAM-dependent methyltransferase
MSDKRGRMLAFWSERVKQFASDPRANTNDIWLREIEINCVNKIIDSYNVDNILDFGCANGYSTINLAEKNPHCNFLGIDINHDMIKEANIAAKECKNLRFLCTDILQKRMDMRFNFIYAIRVFQNIESKSKQRDIFDRLCLLLEPKGYFYFIESYAEGYEQLNRDRAKIDLPLLPIHPHLTLLTDEFDKHVLSRMHLLEKSSPSSSYYLITRLVYSYLAVMNNEPIDYDHPLHRIATLIPAIGVYGPQRAMLLQKRMP